MSFFILGPLKVKVADQEHSIDTAPVRATLIALLLEEGLPVPIPVLLGRIWEFPPKTAANNLRLHISRLRGQLSLIDPIFRAKITTIRGGGGESGGYRLHIGPDELDFTRFQRTATRGLYELRSGCTEKARSSLTQALSLWRGPIGQGCSLSSRARAQFDAAEQLRSTARESLIEALINLGQSAELIPEIRKILELEPHREKSWENLIRAYYLSGDIAKALDAWEIAVSTIGNQYGLDLSPDIQRLHLAVLRRDTETIRAFGSALT
ncbi:MULTISPECIES: AfsR/SARP family transcriptional regulator [Streptomyces]|uniref:AfsR/SARP family transcriptional regulator n=1 Tax=Streptomyces TaxID=1883 RepID=UPI001559ADDA|nr:AfsR/SARP family transcriptional regulator [Streptomyces kasugaensis]